MGFEKSQLSWDNHTVATWDDHTVATQAEVLCQLILRTWYFQSIPLFSLTLHASGNAKLSLDSSQQGGRTSSMRL